MSYHKAPGGEGGGGTYVITPKSMDVKFQPNASFRESHHVVSRSRLKNLVNPKTSVCHAVKLRFRERGIESVCPRTHRSTYAPTLSEI